MSGRAALVGIVTLIACSDREPTPTRSSSRSGPSGVERELASAIGSNLGVPVVVACGALFGLPSSCVATLGDGTRLPLRIAFVNGGWEYALATRVLTTDPIVTYVIGELADLGIADRVTCLPRIRPIDPVYPIECTLARGGKAFVTIDADGGVRDLELALDPISAAARSEELTAERAAALTEMSKQLEHLPDDEE